MNILSNLLPGLRDLRAPLAAGYVWLAATALAVTGSPGAAPPSLVQSGRDAYRAAGPGGRLAALTFAAYLIGVVSTTITTAVGRGHGHVGPELVMWTEDLIEERLDHNIRPSSIANAILAAFKRLRPGQTADMPEAADSAEKLESDLATAGHDKESVARGDDAREEMTLVAISVIRADFDRAALRLRLEGRTESSAAVDKQRSEAEFRWGVAIPIYALALAFSWRLEAPAAAYLAMAPPMILVAFWLVLRGRPRREGLPSFTHIRLFIVLLEILLAVALADALWTSDHRLLLAASILLANAAPIALWIVGGQSEAGAIRALIDGMTVSRLHPPSLDELYRDEERDGRRDVR